MTLISTRITLQVKYKSHFHTSANNNEMACNINFVVKTSLFHAYKFGHLSWCGAVTQARAHVRQLACGAPRVNETASFFSINNLFQVTSGEEARCLKMLISRPLSGPRH